MSYNIDGTSVLTSYFNPYLFAVLPYLESPIICGPQCSQAFDNPNESDMASLHCCCFGCCICCIGFVFYLFSAVFHVDAVLFICQKPPTQGEKAAGGPSRQDRARAYNLIRT